MIGPSGAGKTTLLHVLACALPPSAGSVAARWRATLVAAARELQRLRGRLFLAPQVPPLPPRQRVVTAVLAGRLPAMGLSAQPALAVLPDDIAGAHAALARFDLADKLFERVDRLSGGERQRVGLARALLAPAALWLVDEPLSALDPTRAAPGHRRRCVDAARERGVTLVATLHQVDVALAHFPAHRRPARRARSCFDLPTAAGDARAARSSCTRRRARAAAAGRRPPRSRSRGRAPRAGGRALPMSDCRCSARRLPDAATRRGSAACSGPAPRWCCCGRCWWRPSSSPGCCSTPESLRPTLRFLARLLAAGADAEFLALVARETWRTVAIATAGMALALADRAAADAAVHARAVGVGAGRAHGAAAVRCCGRRCAALLIVLRSVPELVWALVFVRVVGLGPTAGVLAIALTYGGMLGKVYGEILESGETHSSEALLRNGAGRLQAFFYGLLPQNAAELTSATPCTAGNARSARRWCSASSAPAAWASSWTPR